jgi:hypothetical protein
MTAESTTSIAYLVKSNLAIAEAAIEPCRPEPRDATEETRPDLALLVDVLRFLEARATAAEVEQAVGQG